MSGLEIIEFYNSLPTKADQKNFRYSALIRCKIRKMTFYSWLQREDIPDEKSVKILNELIEDFKMQLT